MLMVLAMITEPPATNTCLEEFQKLSETTNGEQLATDLTNLAVHMSTNPGGRDRQPCTSGPWATGGAAGSIPNGLDHWPDRRHDVDLYGRWQGLFVPGAGGQMTPPHGRFAEVRAAFDTCATTITTPSPTKPFLTKTLFQSNPRNMPLLRFRAMGCLEEVQQRAARARDSAVDTL